MIPVDFIENTAAKFNNSLLQFLKEYININIIIKF